MHKSKTKYRTRPRSAHPRLSPRARVRVRDEANDGKIDLAHSHLTFADLFAGIGGMRTAFEREAVRCVFSCEWDTAAATTYQANFGERPAGDITRIHASEIPAHDVLLAGFPCQPFSIAGVSKKRSLGRPTGFQDELQGNLFFDVARIIAQRRPRAFLLENVKNLRSHDGGRTFNIIMRTLRQELGYWVPAPALLDARHVVPQHRERIYIVGFDAPRSFDWPTTPDLASRYRTASTLEEVLEPAVDPKYTLSKKLWDYLREYARKHAEKGNGFGYGLPVLDGITRTLSARYYKDGSEILIRQRDSTRPRRLTPLECARLMGFPPQFKIPVSDTQAYKQFGNSVVVPIVRAIADKMISALYSPVDQQGISLDGQPALLQVFDRPLLNAGSQEGN